MVNAAYVTVLPDFEALFQQIKNKVIERTGLAYYVDNEKALARIIDARIATLGLSGYADYLNCLGRDPHSAEWTSLIDDVTVGETFFFRYLEQWNALRDLILPDCLARGDRQEPLRIWCAGCANGAEPYSMAIMLHKELAHAIFNRDVSILATDISSARLSKAKLGDYTNWDLRATPESYIRDCFVRTGPRWSIREQFKKIVTFQEFNLVQNFDFITDGGLGKFDIILCRNVLIYFDAILNRRLLKQFHACLKEGGWFIAGHAESYLEISNVFHPVAAAGTTLYRKQSARVSPVPQPLQGKPRLKAPCSVGAVLVDPSVPELPCDVAAKPGKPVAAKPPLHAVPRLALPNAQALPCAMQANTILDARRLANAGQWMDATRSCERLIEDDPLNQEAHFLLALVLEHRGEVSAAEVELRRAVYLDPHFALAHYHLAMSAVAQGNVAGARRSLRNVFDGLKGAHDASCVRFGDGLTAAELRQLARMQMGALEGRQP